MTRYGRTGQVQNGVDILVQSELRLIGIQCKCVQNLDIKTIETEIQKAVQFTPLLSSFMFITTLKKDANLHSKTLQISQDTQSLHVFDVSIIFW